jgi:hypothetical protein
MRYAIRVFFGCLLIGLLAVVNLFTVSEASAHNVCGLAVAVEVPCDWKLPLKPGVSSANQKWFTSTEHTPGYHDRIWYNYNPPCTQGPCILPGPFGHCGAYAEIPTPRTFPSPEDITGPTPTKKRLYCGTGVSSPVPHLHYVEPPGS